MKTIRMPQAMLNATLAALRSGEYKEGTGHLCRNGAYCCLGVMQMAIDGEVENLQLPSQRWLKSKGISFVGAAPAGESCNPYLPTLGCSAADANDYGPICTNGRQHNPATFAEIADAWEDAAEGY